MELPGKRERGMRAVILAAGQESLPGSDVPIILQALGDRRIIEYVLQNALQVVAPEDLTVVVASADGPVQTFLDRLYGTAPWRYVVQGDPLGTGHALLQTEPLFSGYDGDLLILYGDTPLFREETIRGLRNRHRLKQAHLTLLSAIVERALPYGRILRDARGRILDIIEDTEATPEMREIRELNVGAYIVQAPAIFEALHALSPSPIGHEIRLTDCVHRMIRSAQRVSCYQIYDQDEVLGINNQDDLEQAEFILKKRLLHPRRVEEHNMIAFGTGGWRAIIGEGFTMHNVRRLCQALANGIVRKGDEARGVLIGYDRRFLSDRAANAAAEVFAGNNIAVTLLSEDAPTPLITYATAHANAALGLAFTASHNPPEWNGLKVFNPDGSLLMDEETRAIEAEANRLSSDEVVKIDLDLALEAGIVKRRDYTNAYVDAVESLIALDVIREAGLKVIVDPMYGVGRVTMGIILTEARCRVTFINERHDPLFGGRSPAPNLDALRLLVTHVRNEGYDLGLATDGDADRIAIVDEFGTYVTVNDLLLLLYWYMHEVRGERGGVVRNLATTHMLDRLALRLGEQAYETPVGFKYIASSMVEHNALLGGESSGGLTIRGHILGKDGIFAAALVVEMLARTRQPISQLLERVHALTGQLYAVEANVVATPEMRIVIPQRIQALVEDHAQHPLYLEQYLVERISIVDGTKFYLANDNWALLRFSGTEPILRIFAEGDTEEKTTRLVNALQAVALG